MTDKTPNDRKTGPLRRPATGRSFVILIIVAAACAIGVTVWRLYSVTGNGRRAASTRFRI
jgi:hypothetical protein